MAHPEEVPVKEPDNPEKGQDNITRLPLGLTRPFVQASSPFQLYKHLFSPEVPLFQEYKRFSRISPKNSSMDMENVNLSFSNVSNDNHHDKIGNSQPTLPNLTCLQLRYLQSLQEKMAMSQASSSSQMTPARMTHTEEKSCNAWRSIRKAHVQKKVPVRKVSHFIQDPVHKRKRIIPANPAYTTRKARVANSVHMWPYRDRVIHLLALKDYKKSELLTQLQKDNNKLSDNNILGKILLQVANLNASTLSYTLKDCMFKEVQRDWPGYNEEDKQSLDLVLSRKLGPSYNAAKDILDPESPVAAGTDNTLSSKDQLFYLVGTHSFTKNMIDLSPPKSAAQSTSKSQMICNGGKSGILPSPARITKSIPLLLPTTDLSISNPPRLMKSYHDIYSAPESSKTQQPCECINNDSSTFERQLNKHLTLEKSTSILHQMKYSKSMESQNVIPKKFICAFAKRKAMVPNYNATMMEKQREDSTKQEECAKLNASKVQKLLAAFGKTHFATASPDYFANYVTIVSPEQRQRYEMEFKVDYNEYKGICDKIQISCRGITALDIERKALSPSSKKYQDITKKISVEYQKMRQINPNFYAEKRRCAYLYSKLIHIKKLINDFDQHQVKV